MMAWAAAHSVYLVLIAGALALLGIILAVVALGMAARTRRRKSRAPAAGLDAAGLYELWKREMDDLQLQVNQLQGDLADAQEALKRKVSAPKALRFNAFGDTGSDLSFSVALVDDAKNGVVISSIYGREESRTYAKPIENGESAYPMTDEEIAVLTGRAPSPEHSRRRRPVTL